MGYVGLVGLFGLLGLLGLKHKIPADRAHAGVRLLGLFGFLGLAGFWIPELGACGAFGALSLYNHPIRKFALLAYLGSFGLIGVALFLLN